MNQTRFLAALSVLLLLGGSGCVSVPFGSVRMPPTEVSRTPRVQEQLKRMDMDCQSQADGTLLIRAVGVYESQQEDVVTLAHRNVERRLAVGLLPREGAELYGDRRVRSPLQTRSVLDILISRVLLGPFCTPLSWVTELAGRWEHQGSGQDHILYSSWAGFAKTTKQTVSTETDVQNKRVHTKRVPASGVEVVAEMDGTGLVERRTTDGTGSVVLDPAQWPVLSSRPIRIRVRAEPWRGYAPDGVEALVPGGLAGKRLPDILAGSAYPFEKVWVEGRMIDFSAGAPSAAPLPRVTCEVLGQTPDRRSLRVNLAVRNEGRGSLYRLSALTQSDIPSFHGVPILFGRIEPGACVTQLVAFSVPPSLVTGPYSITAKFLEANRFAPADLKFAVDVNAVPKPALSFVYRIVDNPAAGAKIVGNSDGVIQKGEAFDLQVNIKNIGNSEAVDTQLILDVGHDPSVTLFGTNTVGFALIKPGGTAEHSFNIALRATSSLRSMPVKLAAREVSYGAGVEQTLDLPFDTSIARQPITVDRRYYVTAPDTVLREGASPTTTEYGRAMLGTLLHGVEELDDWVAVEVDVNKDGHGEKYWVARNTVSTEKPLDQPVAVGELKITRFMSLPPSIILIQPETPRLETTEESIQLVLSVAQSDGRLSDVRLLAGETPETLAETRGIKAVTEKNETTGSDSRVIRHRAPLALGRNIFKVTAESDKGKTSTCTVEVTRKQKQGKMYAVAIGIDTYEGQYALKCAAADATGFADFARKTLGVRSESLWVMVNEQASLRNIMKCFGALRGRVKPEDSVMIFLAGHGMIEKDEKFFVPADAELGNLFGTAIGMDEFGRILDMEAERILVVADVCYSGDIRLRGNAEFFGGLAGKGRLLIGYDGPAREDIKLNHGYLTYYLIDGLTSGQADLDRDGQVTLREAYDYTNRRVKKETGGQLWIKGEGDIELLRIQPQ